MDKAPLDTGPGSTGEQVASRRAGDVDAEYSSSSAPDDATVAEGDLAGPSIEELWIPVAERWRSRDEEAASDTAAYAGDSQEPAAPAGPAVDDGDAAARADHVPAPVDAPAGSPLAVLSEPTGGDDIPRQQYEDLPSTSQADLATPATVVDEGLLGPSRHKPSAEEDAVPTLSVEEVPEAPALSTVGTAGQEPLTIDAAQQQHEARSPTTEPPGTPDLTKTSRRRLLAIVSAAVVAVVAATFAFVASRGQDGLPSDAAFRVDGTVVTKDALQRRVEVLGALYGVTPPTETKQLDAFRRDTAKALVLSLVMADAAHGKGVAVADKVVNDALDRIISQRYPQGGRADFVKALAVQGISEQDVQDELRRQLEVRQLYDQVTSGIAVSEASARKDFLAHPDKYQPPPERHLRELVVADEASARSILAQVKGVASFAALARAKSLDASTRSSGGDLGTVTAAELEPAFATAAFSAAKGQSFGPVHTSLGWYLGVVEDIVQAAAPTFDAVKDQVRQQLENLAQVKAWRAFLQDRLTKGNAQYASAYKPSNPDALPDSGLTSVSTQPTTGP